MNSANDTSGAAPLPTLTTLRRVPPFAVGHVRDMRVRWALEEAGKPYQVRLIDPDEQQSAQYRQLQPFGQVPAYQDGAFELFESAAIVLHIAASVPALLPSEPVQRAQVTSWVFAAINSMEPHIGAYVQLGLVDQAQAWVAERRPQLEEMARKRLAELNQWLKERDYLAGQFSAADILMTGVLRLVSNGGLLGDYPALESYFARCTARPAYAKALADQRAVYAAAAA